ncbi:MAG: chemotaxis protein CheB, partial [Deferrisomatales bacterium]
MARKKGPEAKTPAVKAAPPAAARTPFPIVALGASAGGLEALEQFFKHVPPQSGLAFVVIQHLDPVHKSILAELLQRFTPMPVCQVEDGMAAEPDRVYVIPPNRELAILHGTLHLLEPALRRGLRMPIDAFFRSLAADRGEGAVGVVLSGTGTEGTLGLKEIKGAGGLVLVQAPGTAKYDGMPQSAAATGLADYVLPPDRMAAQILAYLSQTSRRPPRAPPEPAPAAGSQLQKVFLLLRSRTGHDFSLYKHNTILRRIDRRMAVNQLEHLEEYVRYLRESPTEAETLFRELLIEVTSFFRDPGAFESLAAAVLPELLAHRPPEAGLRAWVPGCSTGEEAYSLAMLLRESLAVANDSRKVQLFATDINPEAIEAARRGLYPEGIAADVSPERLRRFFTKEPGGYRVKKDLRDLVVFSVQSVIKDPPFSRLDLVSCRNLLIYLGPELQKRLFPLFHYALNPGGYLFLGSSETIGEFTDLFRPVDRKWKLFRREGRAAAVLAGHGFPLTASGLGAAPEPGRAAAPGEAAAGSVGLRELAEGMLLRHFAPAAALIDGSGDVRYIHGHTGKYLEPAPGRPTLNLLAMAREGLRPDLAAAVRRALADGTEVRREGLRVRADGHLQRVDLSVVPVTEPPGLRGLALVVFEDAGGDEPPTSEPRPRGRKSRRVQELERELASTREHLQTTIEDLETSAEEMKATNEELQSANEELQSTNEELETSKEELQSVNEELTTVNTELENKIVELSLANDDMANLLAATEIGTVFLDPRLRVQRYTPAAAGIIHLIETDVGRPLAHVTTTLEGADLAADAARVLETLAPLAREMRGKDGAWFSLRILPYRTAANVIDGVVLSFIDVTALKRAEDELRRSRAEVQAERDFAEAVVATVREPLLVLDAGLRVASASPAFYREFSGTPATTEGKPLFELGGGRWKLPGLRARLDEVLSRDTAFEGFENELARTAGGRRRLLLSARRLVQGADRPPRILLAIAVQAGGVEGNRG